MAKTRAQISEMTAEERAKFYTEAWGAVKKAVDAMQGPDGDKARAALADIKPSLYGIGGTRVGGVSGSKHVKFYEMFKTVGQVVNEMDVFKTLKIGEREALTLIKSGLVKSEPKDRMWISFKDGNYTLVAKGEVAPKGMENMIPKPAAPKVDAQKVDAPKTGEIKK